MSDFGIKTTVVGADDHSWLGSNHGIDSARTATIDVSKLVSGTHYNATTGVVPSGIGLGMITATGLFAPYSSAASDGSQVLAGFLLYAQQLQGNYAGLTSTQLVVPLLVHGIIDTAHLPVTAQAITGTTVTTGDFVFENVA